MAERFAEAGHHAIVIDYFGRTAGLGPRDENFDSWPHVMETTVEQVQADTAAALAALSERASASTTVTVGFCFGGMQSLLAGTNSELGLAAVIAFYGALDGSRFSIEGPLQRASEIRVPVLGLYGGADEVITVDQIPEFEGKLTVDKQIEVYPGAPHSFFDRKQGDYADASADAWRRVLSFLKQVGEPAAA